MRDQECSRSRNNRYRAEKRPIDDVEEEQNILSDERLCHRIRRIRIANRDDQGTLDQDLADRRFTIPENSSLPITSAQRLNDTRNFNITSNYQEPERKAISDLQAEGKHDDHSFDEGSSSNNRRSRSRQSNSSIRHQKYLDIGRPEHQCEYCGALFWYRERCQTTAVRGHIKYRLCCHGGIVDLPKLRDPPAYLDSLLCSRTNHNSHHFCHYIRPYNNIFAITSVGARVDEHINDGRGPYIFRVEGQVCHRMGSILPPNGRAPAFAQLYMHDTENEIANRMASFSADDSHEGPREEIVRELKHMLDTHNAIVRAFRTIQERLGEANLPEYRLRIRGDPLQNRPQYNMPQASEIVALVVGDISPEERERDLIVEHRSNGLQRVSSTHALYMPMQYPLLFPYGEPGFTPHIRYRTDRPGAESLNRSFVSMLEYYLFRIHPRSNQTAIIFHGGRLFQQYLLDAYACVEQARLHYLEEHQQKLRCDKLINIRNAVLQGDMLGRNIGRRIILPASYVGSPRYMFQNYQDAIAICKEFGPPDLFVTFTCNPQWPEIKETLPNGQTPDERPDILARVFKIKADELLKDIRDRKIFGSTIALVYALEFQKRGLPHIHIIIWLHPDAKLKTPADIDRIIQAEIPDPHIDPEGHKVVSKFMLHGPCGSASPLSSCMKDGYCSRNFPKPFKDCTTIDEDGFVYYRRRDNSISVEKNGVPLNNSHVVPYNRQLLLRYQAHLNVEKCYSPELVKYLFKYVCKGNDRAMADIVRATVANTNSDTDNGALINEITSYLDCRCITPHEAAWRLFKYDIHHNTPSVERLPVHLPAENIVVFHDGTHLQEMVGKHDVERTKLTEWMELNKRDQNARKLTYVQIPQKYTWNDTEKIWSVRKNKRHIGQMFYVSPNMGELYYLRVLLNTVKGATSYEDIRTVNSVLQPSFCEACKALGLLSDDNEWILAMKEAAESGSSIQLRKLFVNILLHCEVSGPTALLEQCWNILSEDLSHKINKRYHLPQYEVNIDHRKNFVLAELEKLLLSNGSSLAAWNLPSPKNDLVTNLDNCLIREQLQFNTSDLRCDLDAMRSRLNQEQLEVYQTIIHSVEGNEGHVFFVYGHGGTGKTFLWRVLTAELRSQGKIVLVVASSGLASLLIQGGTTAYSRFKIPIELSAESTCDIKRGSQLAKLLEHTSLIIWDEAPMNHKHCFEALDRTMRDILGATNKHARNKPFGGKTIVLGGDFRQTLPIIQGATRFETISASITKSYIWKFCRVYKLMTNMRLQRQNLSIEDRDASRNFAEWILALGDGKLPGKKLFDFEEPNWIQIPSDLLINPISGGLNCLIETIYPDFRYLYNSIEYLKERVIVAPTNDDADCINNRLIEKVPGKAFTYLSSDTISDPDTTNEDLLAMYPIEYLNSLKPNGIPNHHLELKIGVPVILLRNIDQPNGLCNGTRLITTKLADRMAKILSLKELQVGMQRIQVICRLMKQWRVFNPITGMLGDYQFIFIDAEGSAVQAKMDPHTYGLLQFTFEEGKVYKLLKFRVVECPKEYKAVKNTVMIIFTTFSTAKALPETQPPLPLYYFDFVPFEDIGVSITYEKAIVDVIGRLLAVGPVQIVGDKESRVRNIDIANERNATLNITIWGDFIDQLGWDSLAQETTHPVVIIFSTMQLRDDKYRGIGLKTCSGTCFYLDSSIPQIAKFEKSIAHEQPPIVIQATHSQQLQPARVPRLTKQLSLAQLLNEDLSANERTNYKCVAEIVDFLNRVEWYYYGCPRCKSSVHTIQRVPKCNACTIDDQLLTKWYRLQLIVADGTAKSNFTVIGQTAEQLIGFSADTVAMDEDPDADDLPEKIISILHKRFLFTVNVNRLSLHASEPEFTVQKIEPVPSDAPDFVADIGSTSKLAIDQSNQLDSILPTQTGLTPLAKTMRITAAQHESHSQYFHSETNVSTSRSPKRKIDFQPERDQFSGDNQDEDKS